MSVGCVIREYRKKNGLSLRELGEMVDLTPQAISQYERGKRGINIGVLFQIMDILGIMPNDFPEDIQEKYLKNINTIFDLKKVSLESSSMLSINGFLETVFKYKIYSEDKLPSDLKKDDDVWIYLTNVNTHKTKKLDLDEFLNFAENVSKYMDFEFNNL